MQNGIGGTSQRHIHCQGIGKSGLRQYNGRCNPFLEHFHNFYTGFLGQAQACCTDSRSGSVTRQRHSQRLGYAIHRVGSKHAGTGAASRTGR